MWQKTFILLDTSMPKSCIECRYFNGFECDITGNIVDTDSIVHNRPSDCPIRLLPQKKHDGLVFKADGRAFTEEMEIGWNACLDEITGEKDESRISN